MGTTGHYVFNFTDDYAPMTVTPLNTAHVLNLTVFQYDKGFGSTTRDIIVVAPNHPQYFTSSPSKNFDDTPTNLSYHKMHNIGYYVFASSSMAVDIKQDGSSPRGHSYPYEVYTFNNLYHNTAIEYYQHSEDKKASNKFTYRTITTNEPDNKEIYGLFVGPLSYTDLKYSRTEREGQQVVYIYGTKYTPKDEMYNRYSKVNKGIIAVYVLAPFVFIFLALWICRC